MSRFGTAFSALAAPDLFWQFGELATFDPADPKAKDVSVIVDPALSGTEYDTEGERDEHRLTILARSADISEPAKGDMEAPGDEWEVRGTRWFVTEYEPETDKGLYRIELVRKERDMATRPDIREGE